MKKNSGETIVEILIATTILVMIITSTYSILLRAMSTNTSIKNRVRALNIAREGIEGVRNIRDTNWLRYSGSRRANWLCRPGINRNLSSTNDPYSFIDPVANINTTHNNDIYNINIMNSFSTPPPNTYLKDCIQEIQSGYYILEHFNPPGSSYNNFDDRYILEPQLAKDPIEATNTTNIQTNFERFRLYWAANSNRTTHASRSYDGSDVPHEESIFSRIIEIEVVPVFEDPTGSVTCLVSSGNTSPDPNCNEMKLKVTSNVEWDEDGDGDPDQSVTLETNLFDYFERTSY